MVAAQYFLPVDIAGKTHWDHRSWRAGAAQSDDCHAREARAAVDCEVVASLTELSAPDHPPGSTHSDWGLCPSP